MPRMDISLHVMPADIHMLSAFMVDSGYVFWHCDNMRILTEPFQRSWVPDPILTTIIYCIPSASSDKIRGTEDIGHWDSFRIVFGGFRENVLHSSIFQSYERHPIPLSCKLIRKWVSKNCPAGCKVVSLINGASVNDRAHRISNGASEFFHQGGTLQMLGTKTICKPEIK